MMFVCPSCNNALRVPDKHAGLTGRCKKCGATITVPSTPGSREEPKEHRKTDPPVPSQATGDAAAPTSDKLPVAGMIVGTLFGIERLLSSVIQPYSLIATRGLASQLDDYLPGLYGLVSVFSGIEILANSALLIGIALTYARHPHGRETVLITSRCMLAAVLLFAIAGCILVTAAVVATLLDVPTALGITGLGFVGAIWVAFHFGLVLLLFRKNV